MDTYKKYINKKYTSNNIQEGLFIIPGILSNIIFTTNYFKRNFDIKEFSTNVLQEDYKEYLFQSRTALYARIIKDIIREKDEKKTINKINSILKFILDSNLENDSSNNKTQKNKITKSKIQTDILGWVNVINPNNEG